MIHKATISKLLNLDWLTGNVISDQKFMVHKYVMIMCHGSAPFIAELKIVLWFFDKNKQKNFPLV